MDILVPGSGHETTRHNVFLQGVESLKHPLILIVAEEARVMEHSSVGP